MREEALEGFEKRCDVMGLPSNWSLAAALRTDCRRAKAKASSFHISNKIKVRQKKTNIMVTLISGIKEKGTSELIENTKIELKM